MTIEKLERVMWRMRTEWPDCKILTNNTLKQAIMKEIGTDPRTYKTNRKALINLGWIRTYNSARIILTDKDIE